MLGRVKVGNREENLMNADRIRRLDDKKGILVTSNKEPILFRARPYFQDSRMKRRVKIKKGRGLQKSDLSDLNFIKIDAM